MRVYDKALMGLMTKNQLKFTRKLSDVVIEDGSEEHKDKVSDSCLEDPFEEVFTQGNAYDKLQVQAYMKEKTSYHEKQDGTEVSQQHLKSESIGT